MNFGGKALTNYLKETVSYRSFNLQEEFALMDFIKQKLCFVSKDVQQDLLRSKSKKNSPFLKNYILPDGVSTFRGVLLEAEEPENQSTANRNDLNGKDPAKDGQIFTSDENGNPEKVNQSLAKHQKIEGESRENGKYGPFQQMYNDFDTVQNVDTLNTDTILPLNNERFMVPEILFCPMDLGLQQQGIPEMIATSIQSLPKAIRGLLAENIVLVGGCVLLPNFEDRVKTEVRALLEGDYEVNVDTVKLPIEAAWKGGALLARVGDNNGQWVTKERYEKQRGTMKR